MPIMTIGNSIYTLSYVTPENEPSNQNVISESCSSDVARYLNSPVAEPHKTANYDTSKQKIYR